MDVVLACFHEIEMNMNVNVIVDVVLAYDAGEGAWVGWVD